MCICRYNRGINSSLTVRKISYGEGVERVRFHAGAAWFPWRSQADWFLGEMRRWGWLDPAAASVAARAYRPDLLEAAARAEGLPWPEADRKKEGGHAAPWQVAARPAPLRLAADAFCDAAGDVAGKSGG